MLKSKLNIKKYKSRLEVKLYKKETKFWEKLYENRIYL